MVAGTSRREYHLRVISGVAHVSHSQSDANQIIKMKKGGVGCDYVSCVLPSACKWNYKLE